MGVVDSDRETKHIKSTIYTIQKRQESYRTGETMNGIPYLLMSLTNAAVSFIVAEQFGDAIEMDAITRAARYGRSTGTCERMECPILDGQLRTVTDYLAGVEEILGYIV